MRILLLTLTLLAGAAHAAQDRLVGTWVGELPNEPEPIVVELTVARIDDSGIAYGMLCHIWKYLGITYVWDLGVGAATAATPTRINRNGAAFAFGFNDVQYKMAPMGSKRLRVHLTRKGQLHKLTLDRTEPSEAPCLSRVKISAAVQAGE